MSTLTLKKDDTEVESLKRQLAEAIMERDRAIQEAADFLHQLKDARSQVQMWRMKATKAA